MLQPNYNEDTEWNDILREKGLIPQKPKELEITEDDVAAMLEEAVNEKIHGKPMDDLSLDELDELEDLEDDRILEEYRRKRIAEMQSQLKRERFGEVTQISEPDFVKEVTEASKDVWVVCHLFKPSIPACKLINAILVKLAARHKYCKFIKIIGDHCIHGYPDKNMPSLLIYGKGDMRKQIVGIQSFPGGMSCTVDDLELFLHRLGAIKSAAALNKEDQVERNKKEYLIYSGSSASKGEFNIEDDDDDDWD